MSGHTKVIGSYCAEEQTSNPTSEPCIMLIFGASGDLTKRLLVPALYNLACDDLLNDNFAILGTAMDDLTTEQYYVGDLDYFSYFGESREYVGQMSGLAQIS